MAFRPLLCMMIDEETVLLIYEEHQAQAVALSLKGWDLHRKESCEAQNGCTITL